MSFSSTTGDQIYWITHSQSQCFSTSRSLKVPDCCELCKHSSFNPDRLKIPTTMEGYFLKLAEAGMNSDVCQKHILPLAWFQTSEPLPTSHFSTQSFKFFCCSPQRSTQLERVFQVGLQWKTWRQNYETQQSRGFSSWHQLPHCLCSLALWPSDWSKEQTINLNKSKPRSQTAAKAELKSFHRCFFFLSSLSFHVACTFWI